MKHRWILFLLILSISFTLYRLDLSGFYINVTPLTKEKEGNLNLHNSQKLQGQISYKLVRVDNPNKDELAAYKLIKQVMDSATFYYNSYTTAKKVIIVYYVADKSVRADGNFNGNLRFGPDRTFMNVGTATHEISHTLGVGTTQKWQSFAIFSAPTGQTTFFGKSATKTLRQISGDANAQLFMDSQYFWPYGLNYVSEYKSESDVINHCKIVNAMLKDGL